MQYFYSDPDEHVLFRVLPNAKEDVLRIPEGVQRLDDKFLEKCPKVKRIMLPSTIGTDIVLALGSRKLEAIEVSADHPVLFSRDGVLFSKDAAGAVLLCYPSGSKARSYIIPDDVTRIGQYAFSNEGNLCNVLISRGVRMLEKYAFACCHKLRFVQMENEQPLVIGLRRPF